MKEKISNATEQAAGKLKEGVGRANDDPDLEAEGRGDHASGKVKQAGENIKDAAKDVFGR